MYEQIMSVVVVLVVVVLVLVLVLVVVVANLVLLVDRCGSVSDDENL
jgi:hypothetical protein